MKDMAIQTDKRRWVYCLSEGDGQPVKLGITQSMTSRHWAIQSLTWRPIFIVWAVYGTSTHETAIKDHLGSRLIRGEWFSDPDNAVKLAADGWGGLIGVEVDPFKRDFWRAAQRNSKRHRDFPHFFRTDDMRCRTFPVSRCEAIEEVAADIGVTLSAGQFHDDGPTAIETILSRLTGHHS